MEEMKKFWVGASRSLYLSDSYFLDLVQRK